jgi:hypothetical protein
VVSSVIILISGYNFSGYFVFSIFPDPNAAYGGARHSPGAFCQPSVVEDPARARAVTSELRSRLRGLEELEARIR